MRVHNKIVLSFIAVALICGGFLLTAKVPSLSVVYQTFVVGLLTALGIHHANDFGTNYLNGSNVHITPTLPISTPVTVTQTDTTTATATSNLPGPTI
jgi:RsiW-degrading membrane proteinase PrsW (M82 family)